MGSIHDVDIRLLRIFHTIAKSGGFSRAQAKLNLCQSAISTHMTQLETRLGTRLCQRGHGVFEITDDGRAVLLATEKLFAALENFRAEVAESRGKLLGELRIGFVDNSVTHPDERIRTAINRFSARAPEVRLKICVDGAIELEEQVMDGRLHLAIGLFHHQIPSLEYHPLFEEEHLLYCGSEHPFFRRSDEDLGPEDVATANYASWDYVEAITGWEPPFNFREAATSPSVEGIAYLVLSGKHLAYLPTHYARSWCERGQLRAILPDATRRTAIFHLITSKVSGKQQLTCAFLSELGVETESAEPAIQQRA
jgi:LysR family transcriptional regulator, transcriptional activator for bauABCD operon